MNWKTITIAIFLAVFTFGVFGTSTTYAQVYASYHQPYQGYQYRPMSDQEYLAYLYGIVSQLQLQVQTHEQIIRGGNTYRYQSQTGRVAGVTYYDYDSSHNIQLDVNDRYYEVGDTVRLEYRIPDEESNDWIGLYETGDSDRNYVWYTWVNNDSGTIRVEIKETGTYEFRYFSDGGYDNQEAESDSFRVTRSGSSQDNEPDAVTFSARNIEDDEAEIRGEVDMNDFRNGRVFFVYGEDEDEVEDVEDEDQYDDVDERGDDLQKILVDSDLDDDDSYSRTITGLDDDTRYYFRICVEYEDEDGDDTVECGDVREFRTDSD